MLHPIAFSEVHTFKALFSEWSQEMTKAPPPAVLTWEVQSVPTVPGGRVRKHAERMTVGPYLHFRGGEFDGRSPLWVKATRRVLDYLQANAVVVERDTISFEIILWENGQALVVAHHGRIIGSHWLAVIDPSTVPREEVPLHPTHDGKPIPRCLGGE